VAVVVLAWSSVLPCVVVLAWSVVAVIVVVVNLARWGEVDGGVVDVAR